MSDATELARLQHAIRVTLDRYNDCPGLCLDECNEYELRRWNDFLVYIGQQLASMVPRIPRNPDSGAP